MNKIGTCLDGNSIIEIDEKVKEIEKQGYFKDNIKRMKKIIKAKEQES